MHEYPSASMILLFTCGQLVPNHLIRIFKELFYKGISKFRN